jgi:prophage maintenance system killer protein
MISDKRKALFYAKRDLAQIVTDVVNLEDINYTVPEVQTLLDGITVGGHRILDELITLNQIKAWKFLFSSLESNSFFVDKKFVCSLHGFVAKEEALTWGSFRGGEVTISGTNYLPPKHTTLDNLWEQLLIQSNQYSDLYDQAIYLFAEMARNKFFYNGNKRTGRMLMSGLLLNSGFPMINVPAQRKTEFNKIMIKYYEGCNIDELNFFLRSCLNTIIVDQFK